VSATETQARTAGCQWCDPDYPLAEYVAHTRALAAEYARFALVLREAGRRAGNAAMQALAGTQPALDGFACNSAGPRAAEALRQKSIHLHGEAARNETWSGQLEAEADALENGHRDRLDINDG
jgi:hypothetical protein